MMGALSIRTPSDISGVETITADMLNHSLSLSSDLAGARPIYAYLSLDNKTLFWGTDLEALMRRVCQEEQVEIDDLGIAFLLQDGVIPPPRSAIKGLYIVGIGGSLNVKKQVDIQGARSLIIDYEQNFPFFRASQKTGEEGSGDPVDTSVFLKLLLSASVDGLKPNQSISLFHSAGKDSNAIALALAEGGYASRVRSITYKARGHGDESSVVSKLARKLGFEHRIIDIEAAIDSSAESRLAVFFERGILPCMDNASLLYPLIARQIEADTRLLDGMGNDVYLGHIAPKSEFKRSKLVPYLQAISIIASPMLSVLRKQSFSKTRAHVCGLSGFSVAEVSDIFSSSPAQASETFWQNLSREHGSLSYQDFRALVRGGIIDPERFTRKVWGAAQVYHWDLKLPWMNTELASYLYRADHQDLYDLGAFRNKVFLRRMLLDRLDLDSDKLGKHPFAFDYFSVLKQLKGFVDDEIIKCHLWKSGQLTSTLTSLWELADKDRNRVHYRMRLLRLFLLSAWFNHSWVFRGRVSDE